MTSNLLSPEEFGERGRAVSMHLSPREVQNFIQEAEDMYVRPAIGYSLYKTLTEWGGGDLSDEYKLLLYGGEWSGGSCGCSDDGVHFCNGLKKAVAYFAYYRMLLADGGIIARAGYMKHNDEYSAHADKDARHAVMDMAELYLSECLEYIKAKLTSCIAKPHGTRVRIKPIGI